MYRDAEIDMKPAAEASGRTRKSLIENLKNTLTDQTSWQEFFDTYWRLIYSVARRAGLTDAEAQDVVQETVITVAKNIKGFEYDGSRSFKGWLLNTARWRITDQFRKRQRADRPQERQPHATRRTATIERIPDPNVVNVDSLWDEEWKNNLLNAAMERVKRNVKPKQYQIFDFYVIKGWPVEKVAQMLGVSRAQVYLVKHRISRAIKREIEVLKANPI